MHYYNENDPKAAAWLREIIREGWIADGWVDERDIREVPPGDLRGFRQCHFFAGIGGWPFALRLAGWPDEEEAWTGSCPCQPFSCAGKRKGTGDERHLWPVFKWIIGERRPAVVFGEQVASKAGRLWLAGVRVDLEGMAYGVGGADLCAAGITAPHLRQRLFWVADNDGSRCAGAKLSVRQSRQVEAAAKFAGDGEGAARVSDAGGAEWRKKAKKGSNVADGANSGRPEAAGGSAFPGADAVGMVHANGCHSQWWSGALQVGWNCIEKEITRSGRKYRVQWRLKPGLSLLADGVPGRVAQLRGFGNAIVPQLAAEFIRAYREAREDMRL